jgi:hypothetical protein
VFGVDGGLDEASHVAFSEDGGEAALGAGAGDVAGDVGPGEHVGEEEAERADALGVIGDGDVSGLDAVEQVGADVRVAELFGRGGGVLQEAADVVVVGAAGADAVPSQGELVAEAEEKGLGGGIRRGLGRGRGRGGRRSCERDGSGGVPGLRGCWNPAAHGDGRAMAGRVTSRGVAQGSGGLDEAADGAAGGFVIGDDPERAGFVFATAGDPADDREQVRVLLEFDDEAAVGRAADAGRLRRGSRVPGRGCEVAIVLGRSVHCTDPGSGRVQERGGTGAGPWMDGRGAEAGRPMGIGVVAGDIEARR